jgi:RNA-directed DNA polymerase
MADRLNKRPGAGRQPYAVTASPSRDPRTKEGSEVSAGEREASRREGRGEVVAEHGTEGQRRNVCGPGTRGTEAQGTRGRDGDAGHHASLEGTTGGSSRPQTVSTKLQRLAEQARRDPRYVFTNLAHLIDVDFLREAYHRTRKSSAPGIDGVRAAQYAERLEENLRALHERLRSGSYRAPAIRRVWISKEDGRQRPIGIPVFEDKIVQRAVAMLLGAIFEQDFREVSYGFREGRSPHGALHELREQCVRKRCEWIVDADIRGFFDSIDHAVLRRAIQRRVNDGRVLRLVGKWLKAGIVDGEELRANEHGTPQGGVISPVLANILLHEVLDEWFVREVQPRMRGQTYLIRFADDFVIGCEREEDARRVMEVLPKRFGRYGLEIHPEKTARIDFRKPSAVAGERSGDGTFDFLGFTHYWGRSRRDYWVIKRKTAKKRIRRTRRQLWEWCRANRHQRTGEQYRALCQKLRGHYQYFGIRSNYRALERVYEAARRTWHYWLSRRSTKSRIHWERFERMVAGVYPLPRPRIVHGI